MHFITFIARNLVRRRTRTVLTVMGIAVSVGAMVALLSVSRRFSEAMEESFRDRGVDLVVLSGGVIDQLSSDIDEKVSAQIEAIPGVKFVTPGLIELVEVKRSSSNVSLLVQGWPESNFAHHDLKLIDGRWMDYSRSLSPSLAQAVELAVGSASAYYQHSEILLGSETAKNLKMNAGDTLVIQRQPFTIVGVYASFIPFEDRGMVLKLRDLQELTGRTGSVTGISVICQDAPNKAELVEQVREKIEALPASGKGRRHLSAKTVRDYLKTAVHLQIAKAMAWMITLIAVVIGTIGMVNTMVMSVLERVHEIGILRAVGWPRSRIVRMVIGEAVMLALLGAVLGIVGAILLVQGLTHMPAVSGFIDGKMSTEAILQGLGMTLIMGLVGGAYPAYRASRMAPTEALRHE